MGTIATAQLQPVHGTEVATGPRETYDDASVDFALENDVVYQHIDPAIGASTHSHGTDIRGNIKIFYTLILDHGNIAGAPEQATEADLGVVRGASALQAIAANGTDILGWSNNRIRQLVGSSNAATVDNFSFVSLTQAEYDALTPDANTVYLVTA